MRARYCSKNCLLYEGKKVCIVQVSTCLKTLGQKLIDKTITRDVITRKRFWPAGGRRGSQASSGNFSLLHYGFRPVSSSSSISEQIIFRE